MEEHQNSTEQPASEQMSISEPVPTSALSPSPPAVEPLSMPPSPTAPTDAPAPVAAMTEHEPISRPGSTSAQISASNNFGQLPNITSLQATPNAHQHLANYQQPITSKPMPYLPHNDYTRASPASTAGPGGNGVPTCQNCQTSTTPLWRRDEMGSVLCNACGLFLKLHGRPRPISLKTDVIKSRNRVKTSRNELAKQKKAPSFPPVSDIPGADNNGVNMATGTPGLGGRRPSGRSANDHVDDNSPISRTGTPNMYNMVYPDMDGFPTQQQPGMAFAMSAGADGRVAPDLNGDHPPTQESIIAENSSLKTRVSELEVIQELYRGRLQQLEHDETNNGQTVAQLRDQLTTAANTEAQLRNELDESHRRENMLKRRLDELELELNEAKGITSIKADRDEDGPPAKKARLDDAADPAEEAPKVTAEAPSEAS